MKKRNAVAYARFSPRPNAADCESCESQLADLRTYCEKHDYEIQSEHRDEALSGGDGWESRPGMLDAVNIAKKGDLFLVRSYDRLFRDVDKATAFRAMLEAKGVEVRSITEESAKGDSMNAKLIRFIFLWIAEYQREIIKARTKSKMLEHQRSGRRMSAEPPYGTSIDPADPDRLVANDDEREVIAVIKQIWQKGKPLRVIARHLNEAGTPNRSGQPWHHQQIKRILVREGLVTSPVKAD